jgi:uncharacterized protein
MDCLWGIDFGARRSGNTAVAIAEDGKVRFYQTKKDQDTDAWLEELIEKHPPTLIAIDAPLTLPAGWCGGIGDLFYRQCDEELRAMSPLFLGGLTGRAVKFHRKSKDAGIKMLETYPKGFVNNLLDGEYPEVGSDLNPILQKLPKDIQLELNEQPANEHQLDALICLVVAFRFTKKEACAFGKYGEGLIWI